MEELLQRCFWGIFLVKWEETNSEISQHQGPGLHSHVRHVNMPGIEAIYFKTAALSTHISINTADPRSSPENRGILIKKMHWYPFGKLILNLCPSFAASHLFFL